MNFFKFKFILPILIGITACLSTTLFFISLNWANNILDTYDWLIYFLPIIGCLLTYVFAYHAVEAHKGTHLIIEEIHSTQTKVPLTMAVYTFLASTISHLFGASVGREGAAVQIAASLGDSLSHFFNPNNSQRKILLTSGIAAGFSAALGAPFAGSLFAMEVLHVRKIRMAYWFECTLAALISSFGVKLLNIPHLTLPAASIPDFSNHLFFSVILSGLLYGFCARYFISSIHFIDKHPLFKFKSIYVRPLLGGFILILLFSQQAFKPFSGLGLDLISKSFSESSPWIHAVGKMICTQISLVSGFKGGEFIPLVIVGSSLGSWLAGFLSVSIPFMASLGFVSVFSAAANTPLACTVLAVELFGPEIGAWAFISCMLAYLISGPKSIYKTQREN